MTKIPSAMLIASLALGGCGEGLTSKATPERLQALMATGLPADHNDKITEEFTRIMSGNEAALALTAQFAEGAKQPTTGADLQQLMRAALAQNADIGRAAQNVNAADSRRLNAIFGYTPQLRLTATYTQNNQNVVESDNAVFQRGQAQYPTIDGELTLTQPLLDVSRIYGIKLANRTRSRAEVDYVAAVHKAIYEVVDAYLQAAQSQQRVQFLQRRARLLTQRVKAETVRGDLGLAEEATANAIAIESADLQVDVAQERARLSRILSDLVFMTGLPVTSVARATLPRAARGTERSISADDAVTAALTNNPKILSTIISVAEGDLRRKQAIAADFAPVLEAFASMRYEDREASRFGGGSVTQDAVFGVRLTVPLFNADGDGYANLVARVDFRDAMIGYLRTRRQLSSEIRATHARMAQLSRSIGQSGAAVSKARQLVAAEETLVEAGQSRPFAVAAREIQAVTAQERAAFYRIEYYREWAKFQYLSGTALVGS